MKIILVILYSFICSFCFLYLFQLFAVSFIKFEIFISWDISQWQEGMRYLFLILNIAMTFMATLGYTLENKQQKEKS